MQVIKDTVERNEAGLERRVPATEQQLIDFVYGSPFDVEASYNESHAIFSPLNTDTMQINEMI